MRKICCICVLLFLGYCMCCPKVVKAEEKVVEAKVEDISMYTTTRVIPVSFFRTGILDEYTYEITISYNGETYVLEKEAYLPEFIKKGENYNFIMNTIKYDNGKEFSEIIDFSY